MKIMNRGMIFSIDAMIAFIIILSSILGFAVMLGNYEFRVSESANQFYLEEKTIMAADSFVKNNSIRNSVFGLAIFDIDKKRVKSNELSLAFSSPFLSYDEDEGFFVKKIVVGEKVLFEDEKESTNCLSVKRFVLFESEKQVVTYTGCVNE